MKKILAMLIVAGLAPVHAEIPPAKVDVRVVVSDQDGKPVPSANCIVSFDAPPQPPQTEGVLNIPGTTDQSGVFAVSAQTRKDIGCGVTKPGYYKTVEVHKFDINKMYDAFAAGKPLVEWQSEPVEMKIVLKKIIKPIPLYAFKARIEVPTVDTPVGFDLAVGDWVAPHGQGKVGDLVFKLDRRFVSKRDYTASLHLGFSSKGDGIQDAFAPEEYGSELRLPHQAPEKNYVDAWNRTDSYPNYPKVRPDQNYFFRVRTVLDEKGEVKSALYGKIYGEIRYDVINSNTAIVLFTYYLNPAPNDRNVEFDVKQNLFTGLKGKDVIKNP
jgi:hypothetical protein